MPLTFDFGKDSCILVGNNEKVAVLNKRSFESFKEVIDCCPAIIFEGLVPRTEWSSGMEALKIGKKRALMTTDVMVYGVREKSNEEAARALAKFGLFLQEPLSEMRLPYENPQDIDVAEFEALELAKDYNLSVSGTTWVNGRHQTALDADVDNFFDFDDFLDHLPGNCYLTKASPSNCLTTQLMP